MKAAGIVRRIDDLGRIVIPKEVRNNLRLREGEPVEIFVDRDGEVILKKYSPVEQLMEFSQEYVDVLYSTTKLNIVIADRDRIIAKAGDNNELDIGNRITKEIEDIINNSRTPVVNSEKTKIICPIVAQGDIMGAVIIISENPISDTEIKLADIGAKFLAKNIEE